MRIPNTILCKNLMFNRDFAFILPQSAERATKLRSEILKKNQQKQMEPKLK